MGVGRVFRCASLLWALLGGACSPAPQRLHSAALESEAIRLEARVGAVAERQRQLADAIAKEDAPRAGKSRSLFVSAQVRQAAQQLARCAPTTPYVEPGVRAYEAAYGAFEEAYLASLLESTDPPTQTGAWTPDAGRDVLGSSTVDAKLATWQALDHSRPFVKFALVRNEQGRSELRVGSLRVGHVDIAGGLALSAGLLRTAVKDGKTQVVVVENTSGGYRPRPLRNRTVLAAIAAAGYLPTDPHDLTVYDNPSGGYEDSRLIRR